MFTKICLGLSTFALVASFGACGGSSGGKPHTGRDASTEAAAEVGGAAGADASTEAAPDAGGAAGADASNEAAPEAGGTAGADASTEAAPEAGGTAGADASTDSSTDSLVDSTSDAPLEVTPELCTATCAVLLQIDCPPQPTMADCVSECIAGATCCGPQSAAYYKCIVSAGAASLTCDTIEMSVVTKPGVCVQENTDLFACSG